MAAAELAPDVTVPGKVYEEYLDLKAKSKEYMREKHPAAFAFAKGNAGIVQAIVGGLGVSFLVSGSWFDNVKLFQDHPWLKPVIVIAAGLYLKSRGHTLWGNAVAAAGGFMLYQWYKNRPTEAKGPDDAGAVYDWSQGAPPASALPAGRVPMNAGERIAERAFRTQAAA
jgi:hypothetical protein